MNNYTHSSQERNTSQQHQEEQVNSKNYNSYRNKQSSYVIPLSTHNDKIKILNESKTCPINSKMIDRKNYMTASPNEFIVKPLNEAQKLSDNNSGEDEFMISSLESPEEDFINSNFIDDKIPSSKNRDKNPNRTNIFPMSPKIIGRKNSMIPSKTKFVALPLNIGQKNSFDSSDGNEIIFNSLNSPKNQNLKISIPKHYKIQQKTTESRKSSKDTKYFDNH